MQVLNHLFLPIICCTLVLAMVAEQHPEHTWDYGESKGPSHWAELSSEFAPCATGHRQSPIDIHNPQKADLPPIVFDYKPSTLRIIDALKQFHFHRPSEETIDGKRYEMVVHLVHAGEEGKLAVVAVLLQKGKDNLLVHEL